MRGKIHVYRPWPADMLLDVQFISKQGFKRKNTNQACVVSLRKIALLIITRWWVIQGK